MSNLYKIAKYFLIAPALIFSATPLHAQISIDLGLGGDVGEIKRALVKQGYSRIDFTGRGFTKYRVQACKDGKRFSFKADWRGKTNDTKVIGKCRIQVNAQRVRDALRQAGYRRINMDNQNGLFVAIACRQGKRHRIEVNRYGDVKKQRRIGVCEKHLSPTDVEVVLKQNGYNRFKWQDRQLPKYVVEACRDRQRLELTVNRFAEVKGSRNLGDCRRKIDPSRLPKILADKGLKRVKVTDDRWPPYAAIACRKSQKVEVAINRFGRITDEVVIGRCRTPMNAEQIVSYVRERGFKRVGYEGRSGKDHTISACHSDQRYRFTLNHFGELRNEESLGQCKSTSLFDIVDRFEGRGISRTQLYLVGCRRGKKIQIELNEFGDRIGREQIGVCHN